MSDQHHAYLAAMGIDVWVERAPSIPAEKNNQTEPTSVNKESTAIKDEIPVAKQSPSVNASLETVTVNLKDSQPVTPQVETLDWQTLGTVISECQKCELSKTRSKTLPGAGNQAASLMIIGDSPNEEDEQQGMPFSGEAGKLLTAMLKAMGYQRNEVYITTLVKCRTTKNQEPSVDEVAACDAYLKRQINLVQPDLILALGGITAQRLLKNKSTLGRLRGQLHYVDGITSPVIVSFEPAYLLRSPNEKRKAWDDLKMAMKQLTVINEMNAEK